MPRASRLLIAPIQRILGNLSCACLAWGSILCCLHLNTFWSADLTAAWFGPSFPSCEREAVLDASEGFPGWAKSPHLSQTLPHSQLLASWDAAPFSAKDSELVMG